MNQIYVGEVVQKTEDPRCYKVNIPQYGWSQRSLTVIAKQLNANENTDINVGIETFVLEIKSRKGKFYYLNHPLWM